MSAPPKLLLEPLRINSSQRIPGEAVPGFAWIVRQVPQDAVQILLALGQESRATWTNRLNEDCQMAVKVSNNGAQEAWLGGQNRCAPADQQP